MVPVVSSLPLVPFHVALRHGGFLADGGTALDDLGLVAQLQVGHVDFWGDRVKLWVIFIWAFDRLQNQNKTF